MYHTIVTTKDDDGKFHIYVETFDHVLKPLEDYTADDRLSIKQAMPQYPVSNPNSLVWYRNIESGKVVFPDDCKGFHTNNLYLMRDSITLRWNRVMGSIFEEYTVMPTPDDLRAVAKQRSITADTLFADIAKYLKDPDSSCMDGDQLSVHTWGYSDKYIDPTVIRQVQEMLLPYDWDLVHRRDEDGINIFYFNPRK